MHLAADQLGNAPDGGHAVEAVGQVAGRVVADRARPEGLDGAVCRAVELGLAGAACLHDLQPLPPVSFGCGYAVQAVG